MVKTSWRFTRVLSGTAAPKSRRSSSLRCSQGSVLRIPNTAPRPKGTGLTHRPWPCPASHLGRGLREQPRNQALSSDSLLSSCYPADTPFSCQPMMPREASDSIRDSPCQRQTGDSPSRGPRVEKPEVPTALPQPSPTCLDTMPPSGVGGWGRPHRGQDGAEGSAPTEVVRSHDYTVASSSWLQASVERRLVPRGDAGSSHGHWAWALGSPAISALWRDGDVHLQSLGFARNAQNQWLLHA